jgi:DNA-binding NarL/FixJ family response regulator
MQQETVIYLGAQEQDRVFGFCTRHRCKRCPRGPALSDLRSSLASSVAAPSASMAGSVGIAVVAGEPGLHQLASKLLSTSREFHCCGFFRTAADALKAIPGLEARVVLVALALPDLCGIRLISELRHRRPALRFILMTKAPLDWPGMCLASEAGANWCCPCPPAQQQLLLALRLVLQRCHARDLKVPLTAREEDILACLDQGLEYKDIPDRLHISLALVKKLGQRTFHKLGVHSRTQAVNQWHQLKQLAWHDQELR